MLAKFDTCNFKINDKLTAKIDALEIEAKDLIVLVGANSSGKSSIAKAIVGALELKSGSLLQDPLCKTALVSFEEQEKLFSEDFKIRNDDTNSYTENLGICVSHLLQDCNKEHLNEAMKLFNIKSLLDRPIRTLSGGEGRKVLITKALCSNSSLIVLDTPFDALDTKSRNDLLSVLDYIHKNTELAIVLIVNRKDEIPKSANKYGLIASLTLEATYGQELLKSSDFKSLLDIVSLPEITLPDPPCKYILQSVQTDTLVSLKNIKVTYDRELFHGLNFELKRGEHYQITGSNGSGKSTLISLITGDNPLVYVNDITVLGYRRGSGESIWDIKKNIGFISGALHLDYRVSAPVINVVLSGFYDSIGLYQRPSDDELFCARKWLALAGLSKKKKHESFKSLSFGQQRLILIIRALVKLPALLILDEPLQGLDNYARELVKEFVSLIAENKKTSIIFVSHHKEDLPRGINNTLTFVKVSDEPLLYDIVDSKALTNRQC